MTLKEATMFEVGNRVLCKERGIYGRVARVGGEMLDEFCSVLWDGWAYPQICKRQNLEHAPLPRP